MIKTQTNDVFGNTQDDLQRNHYLESRLFSLKSYLGMSPS